jgi:hypothetical protein
MFKLTVLVVTIALAAVVALGQAPTLQILTPDGPNLPADLFYGNVKVKPLRLRPGTNTVITIDDSDFFVNQHYVDFLNRFPDSGGFAFWNGLIASCNGNQTCINAKRIDVSNAFSFELEFGATASYVYRLYRGSFGNSQPFPNPIPDAAHPGEENKVPLYSKFKADRQTVVGAPDLAAQQLALATDFASRTEFLAKYPASLTLSQFVDAIVLTIQNDIGANLNSQKPALVGLGSRAAVLYRLSNDDLQGGNGGINNRPFIDVEYNRAFVYAQYGGYLRRDGDIAGFLFWLGQVNSAPLRDTTKQHSMVCSFITSDEYQFRFGNTATHHNNECN